MPRIVKRIDKFEVLRTWEASKFASHPGAVQDRVLLPYSLREQRLAFRTATRRHAHFLHLYMPNLFFEGRDVDWNSFGSLAMPVASHIVGQWEMDDGYFVIIANNEPATMTIRDTKFSWKMSLEDFILMKPYFGAKNRFDLCYFDKNLVLRHCVSTGQAWIVRCRRDQVLHHVPGMEYMFKPVDKGRYDENSITLDLFRGHQIRISFSQEAYHRPIRRGSKVMLSRQTFALTNYLMRPNYDVVCTYLHGDEPIQLRVNSNVSFWRSLKRWWQGKPKLSDFELVDPEKGYLNYKADEED